MDTLMEGLVLVIAAVTGSGGLVSIIVSHMLKRQEELIRERDQINDDRYAGRVREEQLQLRLFLAGCKLVDKTAKTLTDRGIVNGELKDERDTFNQCKEEYARCINDSHAAYRMERK